MAFHPPFAGGAAIIDTIGYGLDLTGTTLSLEQEAYKVYINAGGLTITSATPAIMPYDTEAVVNADFSLAGGVITVNANMTIKVDWHFEAFTLSSGTASLLTSQIYIDGIVQTGEAAIVVFPTGIGLNAQASSQSSILTLTSGQTLDIRAARPAGSQTLFTALGGQNSLSITRLA